MAVALPLFVLKITNHFSSCTAKEVIVPLYGWLNKWALMSRYMFIYSMSMVLMWNEDNPRLIGVASSKPHTPYASCTSFQLNTSVDNIDSFRWFWKWIKEVYWFSFSHLHVLNLIPSTIEMHVLRVARARFSRRTWIHDSYPRFMALCDDSISW